MSVFRLFARSSISSLRCLTCSFVARSPLEMVRPVNIHKCFKSSTNVDLSKVSNSLPPDDFDYDEDSSILEVDVDAVTGGDPDKLKALKSIQLQVQVLKLQELEIPSSLSIENWKELMMMSTISQRKKFLRRLWLKEMKANAKAEERREKQASYKKFKASQQEKTVLTTSSPFVYSLKNVFLFQMIPASTINQLHNYKLLQAEWFGPHLIFDCSYDSFMSPKNLVKCVSQMIRAWSTNRENCNPFDIFFCGLDRKGRLWPKLADICPSLNLPDCPIHHTDEHYLKFFPKEKLVYLTPHCNEVLEEFNPNDIYIIGAYVDFGSVEQLSLAKAKKEGLRKAKLPLDKYLKWKQGSKSLTIPTVLAILNDLKDGHSWPEALKQVPQKCVEYDINYDDSNKLDEINRLTAKSIRETYRKNLVYDLLLNKKLQRPTDKS